MELLYEDALVLIAETKELSLENMRKWGEGMEGPCRVRMASFSQFC